MKLFYPNRCSSQPTYCAFTRFFDRYNCPTNGHMTNTFDTTASVNETQIMLKKLSPLIRVQRDLGLHPCKGPQARLDVGSEAVAKGYQFLSEKSYSAMNGQVHKVSNQVDINPQEMQKDAEKISAVEFVLKAHIYIGSAI